MLLLRGSVINELVIYLQPSTADCAKYILKRPFTVTKARSSHSQQML